MATEVETLAREALDEALGSVFQAIGAVEFAGLEVQPELMASLGRVAAAHDVELPPMLSMLF